MSELLFETFSFPKNKSERSHSLFAIGQKDIAQHIFASHQSKFVEPVVFLLESGDDTDKSNAARVLLGCFHDKKKARSVFTEQGRVVGLFWINANSGWLSPLRENCVMALAMLIDNVDGVANVFLAANPDTALLPVFSEKLRSSPEPERSKFLGLFRAICERSPPFCRIVSEAVSGYPGIIIENMKSIYDEARRQSVLLILAIVRNVGLSFCDVLLSLDADIAAKLVGLVVWKVSDEAAVVGALKIISLFGNNAGFQQSIRSKGASGSVLEDLEETRKKIGGEPLGVLEVALSVLRGQWPHGYPFEK